MHYHFYLKYEPSACITLWPLLQRPTHWATASVEKSLLKFGKLSQTDIADEARDFPCIAVLIGNPKSAPPVFWSALICLIFSRSKASIKFRKRGMNINWCTSFFLFVASCCIWLWLIRSGFKNVCRYTVQRCQKISCRRNRFYSGGIRCNTFASCVTRKRVRGHWRTGT